MSVSVWMSKEWHDVIPFDRIICVKDNSTGPKAFLEVILEHNHCVVVHPQEIDDFMESYKTYLAISELVSLGVDTLDDPTAPIKKTTR